MKTSIGAKIRVYPTPVWVIGTYDKEGKPNAMTAAWGGVCCSDPPAVGVSLRKATYTYGNIVTQQAFTVNIPSVKHVKEADYFGIASGKRVDKFQESGLTAVKSDLINAPYIEEFPINLECRLLHTIEIGRHTQFIGEILDIKVNVEVLNASGEPDVEMINPLIYIPGASLYYGFGNVIAEAFACGKEVGKIK